MYLVACGLCLLSLGSPALSSPVKRAPTYTPNPERANAVKATFQHSWNGYYKYAFPHDSLRPINNGWVDDRNGWGASAIDALSTALVMGNVEVVGQILDFIPNIDFSKTQDEVSVFETTIRYLGGLISAYDLLTQTSEGQGYGQNPALVKSALDQAVRLADLLKVAFETPSGVPFNTLNISHPEASPQQQTNGIATIGTLVLEWTRLSDITGDPQYGRLAQKAEEHLINPQPAWAEPWPGLIGTNVDINTGLFVDASGGWNGGTDSFYEYLIKMYLYDPYRFAQYKDRWIKAADSSIAHLVSHPTSRPELTFLAAYRNQTLNLISQHLACFDGGNFILGGLTLQEPDYVTFGLELTAGCYATYRGTATGIGPETFQWKDNRLPANASNNPNPPADQADFYARTGFWIRSAGYLLRPEVIESYYYSYRATGDSKYQDWAWEAYLAINSTTAVGSGYSALKNVNAAGGGGFEDFQESFWFAEVLKYTYLIFAEDADWQVKADGTNKWVYNTECHPVKIPGGKGGDSKNP